jgi:hypothetical protein
MRSIEANPVGDVYYQLNIPGANYSPGTDVIVYNLEIENNTVFALYKVG